MSLEVVEGVKLMDRRMEASGSAVKIAGENGDTASSEWAG